MESNKTVALLVAAVLAISLAGNFALAGSGSHAHSYSHGSEHSYYHGYGYHRGGGARFAFIAAPLFPAWYYYPEPYYFPPAYLSQAPLPLYYVEKSDPEPKYYWFFCQATGTYYPYVGSCATGWQPVLPHSDAK